MARQAETDQELGERIKRLRADVRLRVEELRPLQRQLARAERTQAERQQKAEQAEWDRLRNDPNFKFNEWFKEQLRLDRLKRDAKDRTRRLVTKLRKMTVRHGCTEAEAEGAAKKLAQIWTSS